MALLLGGMVLKWGLFVAQMGSHPCIKNLHILECTVKIYIIKTCGKKKWKK